MLNEEEEYKIKLYRWEIKPEKFQNVIISLGLIIALANVVALIDSLLYLYVLKSVVNYFSRIVNLLQMATIALEILWLAKNINPLNLDNKKASYLGVCLTVLTESVKLWGFAKNGVGNKPGLQIFVSFVMMVVFPLQMFLFSHFLKYQKYGLI